MECLCDKLSNRQYDDVTEAEAAILRRTWVEANHLFKADQLVPEDIERSVQGRKRLASSPAQATQSQKRLRTRSTIDNLVETYCCQDAFRFLSKDSFHIQQEATHSSHFVRLFLTFEKGEQNIRIQQIIQRTCCYKFAQLHRKNTSVDPVLREIENALPYEPDVIRQKVYYILRIGAKWLEIVENFASIVEHESWEVTGLICLLGSVSTWERASSKAQQSALIHLSTNTDICAKAIEFAPRINSALHKISSGHSFVDETRRLPSHPQLPGTRSMPLPTRSRADPATTCSKRYLHSEPRVLPPWKLASLEAVLAAVPELGDTCSEDAKILLLFLSLFSACDAIPLGFLSSGAAPRKRWTAQGTIMEVDATSVGLVQELSHFLTDISRLRNAFEELSPLITMDFDQTHPVGDVANRVCDNLSAEDLLFWRYQALIVAYRAVTWRYIESAAANTKLFLPHLKCALESFPEFPRHLSASTRADLGLTLLEATRYPTMAWKQFALSQAEIASYGTGDPVLHSKIAQTSAILSRIRGKVDTAISSVDDATEGLVRCSMDHRINAIVGQIAIQRSLNCVQSEDLSTAQGTLEDWKPLSRNPTLMEQTVILRKEMLLGRIQRFQGAFQKSQLHLSTAMTIIERCKDLAFGEDLPDLICDYADTLRELDDPVAAEHELRTQIARENRKYSSGASLLRLALAESLFAQGRLQEAENLCLDVQSRPHLLKFEKLRLYIIMAKIRHMECDNEGAFACWSEAVKASMKFNLTNGRTTRIIVVSTCDTLSRLGYEDLLRQSQMQVTSLDASAKPGGVQYWIAGMRHWSEYIQSQRPHSHV